MMKHSAALQSALRDAANEIVDLGCTCPSRARTHQKDCSGLLFTAKYFKLLAATRRKGDKDELQTFYSGVLAALAVVYDGGADGIAEEIIKAIDPRVLLRVATADEDYMLPKIRETIRHLNLRVEPKKGKRK